VQVGVFRNKVLESKCDIFNVQETKREVFDHQYVKKLCPPCFDAFCYLPSVGASGGILVA
jgi:hypothetical protein